MIFRRLSMTLIAALTAIAVIPANANCQNPSCGCTEVGVDALYWRPFGAGPFVGRLTTSVTPTEGATVIDCQSARPDYDWGVRVYGRYFVPCSSLFFGAEYSWFEPSDTINIGPLAATQTFVGPFFNLINGNQFEGTNTLTHHAFDVVAGYCLCCKPGACVSVAAGVQYLNLEDQLKGNASLDTNATRELAETAKFSGAGPLVRWDMRSTVLGCVTVRASALAGGLVGDREFTAEVIERDQNGLVTENLLNKDCNSTFVPLVGTDLALAYQMNFCGICWGIEGGYRARSYFHVLNAEACDANLQNVTVAGPYFGLNAMF